MKRWLLCVALLVASIGHAANLKILSPAEWSYISNRGEVRVAVFDEAGIDPNTPPLVGEFYNLNLNYLKRVSTELGIKLKFIEFQTVEDISLALESNQVDLAVGFNYDGQGFEPFISSHPFIKSSVAYWSLSETKDTTAPDFRWACVEDSIYCDVLSKQGFSNTTPTKTFENAISGVRRGDYDAVLASYISLSEYLNQSDELRGTLHTPEWGGLVNAHIVANKSQDKLIKIINKIIKLIEQESYLFTKNNPYHVADMANIAYRVKNEHQDLVRYSFDDDTFPLLFRDPQGQLSGYIHDLLALIESRTELRFQYVEPNGDYTLVEMLERGEIDLIPYSLKEMTSRETLDSTDTILSFRYYGVSLVDKPNYTAKIDGVLLASSKSKLGVKEQVFGNEMKMFTTPKTILRALEAGKIEKAYIREDIIDMIISSHADDDYVIDRKDFKTLNAVMAVSASKPLLTNLLNNVVRTWDGNELQKIKNSYDPFHVVYGVDYRDLTLILVGIIGVILLLAGLGYLWFKNLNLQMIIKENDAQASRLEKKFLQSVIEQFPAQVFIHNSQDDLLLSSCIKYRKGECSQCDLINRKDATNIVDRKQRQAVLQSDQTIQRTVDVTNCALDIETIEYTCKRITANNNDYVLTILNDISEKQKQERELIAAKQKAEEAISVREKFLASMSHELRTPIAGMSGLLEMLMGRITDGESRMLLSNISVSARQLNMLVNDILDFSKLEANQLKLDMRECSLLKATGDVLRTHMAAAQDKGLNLQYHFAPTNIETITFDTLRYAQIVNNLLSNAIKFTEKGDIQVDVSLDDTSIKMSVTDSGCGMSPQQVQHVFSPFVQADNSIARKYGGTGLGLSIVAQLVELMGGELNLSSIEGLGTRVDLQLPHQPIKRYKTNAVPLKVINRTQYPEINDWLSYWGFTNAEHSSTQTVLICDDVNTPNQDFDSLIRICPTLFGFKQVFGNEHKLTGTPLFPDLLFETLSGLDKDEVYAQEQQNLTFNGRVLVAEDNPINQLVISKQLQELGVKADIVDDGAQALTQLKTYPDAYQLLITDCHMPVMDGYELVRQIRTSPSGYQNMVIIGCTAEDSRIAHDKAKQVGFDNILYKPYGIDKLRSVIEQSATVTSNQVCKFVTWLEAFSEQEAETIAQVFIDSMLDDLNSLKKESISGTEARKLAHKVKGGASTLGITQLAETAHKVEREAEQVAKHALLPLVSSLVTAMEEQIEHAQRYQRGER
ncbi:transporter substrate-binding domain-containing protein [Vibrio aquaticus]|uniref:histidine kinase n=1 Tax=Vibrio aquaticus TaxID=2496559 RepID=A0A432D0Q7_9VIBR|nr:ATP-binding protein [Vibrio aquaticus]RTZ17523.1 transporter substrate-binding domain-containing protein [Vibrio aquaticus]